MKYMERERGDRTSGVPGTWAAALLKSLLLSYILTVILLGVLAFLLYKLRLSEKMVSGAIIAIYVAATLFGGFITGKKMGNRRFLWGLILGGAYFVILTVVSLAAGKGGIQLGNAFFTTLVLCAGGGMLGGMLS